MNLELLRRDGLMRVRPEHLGITPTDRAQLTADAEAHYRQLSGAASGRKAFLINVYKKRVLPADHPTIRIGQSLLPLAAEYFGEPAQFYRGDVFVTLPVKPKMPRFMSQKWHRDAEADTLFKLFLYLSDVTPAHAPFEYMRGSSHGRLPTLCGERQYASDPIMPRAVQSICGPAGTAFLVDTGGIHRGGYGTVGPRFVAMWTYLRCRDEYESLVKVA